MMNVNSNKKIIMLGLILLLLAGIIVVALKGMKVDLMLEQHKSIDLVIGKEFELKDIKSICDEVFGDKKVVLRKIEVFEDAVNINVGSITDEEKSNLINKINEKYQTSLVTEEIVINSNSNVRIRDMIKPYILPLVISMVMIYVYIAIRFNKLNIIKTLGMITTIMLVSEAIIASIVAVIRIPVTPTIINLMAVIAIVEIVLYINKKEKELKVAVVEATQKKK